MLILVRGIRSWAREEIGLQKRALRRHNMGKGVRIHNMLREVYLQRESLERYHLPRGGRMFNH